MPTSIPSLGLSRRGQNAAPKNAVSVDVFSAARRQSYRNERESPVQKTDHAPGFAGHGRMHGVAGKLIAEDRIVYLRRHAAHQISRIKILNIRRNIEPFKISDDLLLKIGADIAIAYISRRIGLGSFLMKKLLPCSLGHNDQRMVFLLHPATQ